MELFIFGFIIGGGIFGMVGFLLGGKSAIDYANQQFNKYIEELKNDHECCCKHRD